MSQPICLLTIAAKELIAVNDKYFRMLESIRRYSDVEFAPVIDRRNQARSDIKVLSGLIAELTVE